MQASVLDGSTTKPSRHWQRQRPSPTSTGIVVLRSQPWDPSAHAANVGMCVGESSLWPCAIIRSGTRLNIRKFPKAIVLLFSPVSLVRRSKSIVEIFHARSTKQGFRPKPVTPTSTRDGLNARQPATSRNMRSSRSCARGQRCDVAGLLQIDCCRFLR